jgi:hypothetical protein
MGVFLPRLGAFLQPAAPLNPMRRNDVRRARAPAKQRPPIALSSLTTSLAATSRTGHWPLTNPSLSGFGNSALTVWLGFLALPLIPRVGMVRSIPRQVLCGQTSMDQTHA